MSGSTHRCGDAAHTQHCTPCSACRRYKTLVVQTTDLSPTEDILSSAGTGTAEDANGPVSGDSMDQRSTKNAEYVIEVSVWRIWFPTITRIATGYIATGYMGCYSRRKSLVETGACPWQYDAAHFAQCRFVSTWQIACFIPTGGPGLRGPGILAVGAEHGRGLRDTRWRKVFRMSACYRPTV